MNELIAKLYDQAIVLEDGGDYVAGELNPVKFAELLIAEALAEVEKNFVGAIGTYAGVHNTAVKRCADGIKTRFGVE